MGCFMFQPNGAPILSKTPRMPKQLLQVAKDLAVV